MILTGIGIVWMTLRENTMREGPRPRRKSQQRRLRRSSQRNKIETNKERCHRSQGRRLFHKELVSNAINRSSKMRTEKTDNCVSQSLTTLAKWFCFGQTEYYSRNG